MAIRHIPYSDFSGEQVPEGERAKLIVHEHEALEGPVYLDATRSEAEGGLKLGINAVRVEIMLPDEAPGEHTTVIMDRRNFNKWLGMKDEQVVELLENAEPAVVAMRAVKKTASESLSFATLETAGRKHRGKTTDAEKAIVQEHFDEINARLATEEGERQIDLANPEHRARYGLDALARERGILTDQSVEQPQLSLAPDGETTSPTE